MFFLLPSLNSRTIALLAIVCGLVVLCLGLWYIWNAQQTFQNEMQYVRNQCEMMQKKIGQTSTSVMGTVHQSVSNATAKPLPSTAVDVDEVVHRSCALVNAADTVLATTAEATHGLEEERMDTDLSESEDDSSNDDDEAYNDNDQDVDTTDLVEQDKHVFNDKDNALDTAVLKTDATSTTSTNELVETLLSNLVQQGDETTPTTTAGAKTDENATSAYADESGSMEDFVENNGNYTTLAETLRKKTVVELKKMCADYQIGVKKGKSFKRKEELIVELVDKMPQQTA